MDELIGKTVKVVYEDNGTAKVIRGLLSQVDDTFVYVQTKDKKMHGIGKRYIISVSEMEV